VELVDVERRHHGAIGLLHEVPGRAGRRVAGVEKAVEHQDEGQGRVVARFDVDDLIDYRARRPTMTYATDRWTHYDAPELVVHLLYDAIGTPFLLLTGPEPDMRWEGFADAVRKVIEHFEVRLSVTLGSVPMAVPHTRPVQLTNHATSTRLLVSENVWAGEIRIPSSAQSLLEVRLGEWGHDACGFVAHIPHYLAQFGYPEASSAMLTQIGAVTGLAWDTSELDEAAEQRRVEIATQVADSDEVRAVVEGLEQQYDAFHRGEADSLMAEAGDLDPEDLPTGEEIGAQFEQFLAGLDDDGRGGQA
jgi:hypothetical protein